LPLPAAMLYFQMVIMAGTVMLAYYFEYTDTFAVNVQGFFCYEGAYRKPYPGPEDSSAVPPVLLYSLTAGVPVLVIIVGETAVFCLQLATKDFENQEKTILTGDCCYINPLVRRTIRFLGIYAFGLFATDIFVNAGQVVTGNLAPHFLALCKPNYTALGCKQYTQFISSAHACTGNPDLIMKARKTFPSKEAALSIYAAMYLAVSILITRFSVYFFPVSRQSRRRLCCVAKGRGKGLSGSIFSCVLTQFKLVELHVAVFVGGVKQKSGQMQMSDLYKFPGDPCISTGTRTDIYRYCSSLAVSLALILHFSGLQYNSALLPSLLCNTE
uniref:Phospholipid phosphatase related 5 n=1 Tax=Pavo cristatus TaxID=9049 RepID=A0A8C9FZY8_PAVCR